MANSTVAVRNTAATGARARPSPARWARGVVEDHPALVVVGAVVVATMARLTYGTVVGHRVLGPDESTYASAAHDLAQHGLFSSAVHGLPFWSPGYPMLLGAINAVFGDATFPVTALQAGIIGVTTWLTYRLGLRVVGSRAALLAALLMSASLVWLALATPLMYEQTLALLFVGLCLLLLRAEAEPRTRRWYVAAGAVAGLAVVVQDKVLTLLPVVVVWMCWSGARPLRGRVAAAATFLAAAAVVVAPFVVRNQIVYDRPLLLSDSHGWNLLIGHSPGADGGFVAVQPARVCGSGVASGDPRVRAVRDPGRAGEDDGALTSCAIDYALAHPQREVELVAIKAARFWRPFVGPYENNWSHPFDVRRAIPSSLENSSWFHGADVVLTALWTVATVGVFLVGAVVALRRRHRAASLALAVVGWIFVTHVLTFADPRFRIPVLPLITLFQAAGVVALVAWWRSRRPGSAVPDAASEVTRGSEVCS